MNDLLFHVHPAIFLRDFSLALLLLMNLSKTDKKKAPAEDDDRGHGEDEISVTQSGRSVVAQNKEVASFVQEMDRKISSNERAQKYKDYWGKKIGRLLDLESESDIRSTMEEIEGAFDLYAGKIPEYIESRLEPQVEEMIDAGTLSKKGAERLRKGWEEGIVNTSSGSAGGSREMKLKYLEQDLRNLEERHEAIEGILKEKESMEEILGTEIPCSFAEIPFFSPGELKKWTGIFDLIPKLLNCDLSVQSSPNEILRKMKDRRMAMEKEMQIRNSLLNEGEEALDAMKEAFKYSGWAPSIGIFGDSLRIFLSLKSQCQGKGGMLKYYNHLARIALADLKKAQKESADEIKELRESYEENLPWNESLASHRELLAELNAIPPKYLTSELRKERIAIVENIKLCLLELKSEPFEKHVHSQREIAEKIEDPEDSLSAQEHILALAKAYSPQTEGIMREEEVLEANIGELEAQIEEKPHGEHGKGGEEEGLTTNEKVRQLMVEEEGDLVISYVLASQDRKGLLREGDEVQQEAMTQEEDLEEEAERIEEDWRLQALDHPFYAEHEELDDIHEEIEAVETVVAPQEGWDEEEIEEKKEEKIDETFEGMVEENTTVVGLDERDLELGLTSEFAQDSIDDLRAKKHIQVTDEGGKVLGFEQTRLKITDKLGARLAPIAREEGLTDTDLRQGISQNFQEIKTQGHESAIHLLRDVEGEGDKEE